MSAVATSSSQISVSWNASTDNVGVTGYLVERSQGAGSTAFAQVGTVPGTNYGDSGLLVGTVYNYRVRATDAATNLSGYSSGVSATTLPASSGLVAAYAFNEGSGTTVADASGNGNNGTINGATWTTGQYGQALSFNGSGARVTVNDAATLDLTNGMTLEAWVYPTAVGGWRDVIYKEINDIYYLMGSSQNGSLPSVGGTFATTAAFGTTSLPLNTWTHLAGTYDGAMMRLYVNGVQVSSRAQTGSIHTSTGVLSIGGDGLYGQYWAGRIDEVRIYNRALSQAQIQSDMNTALTISIISNQSTIVVSRPIIQSITVADGNTTLTWSAIAGKSYRVQYKLDLSQTDWSDLAGDVTASDTNAIKVDTTVSNATNRFYRIQVLP